MDDSARLDISLNELFFLLGNAIKKTNIKEETKSHLLFILASDLKEKYKLGKEEMKEAISAGGHDFKEPEKVIVATRTVPVSHSEELGSNGLIWRDLHK